MIYLFGDIHGEIEISKLSSKKFPEGKTLTKNDYVIILGDFGLVWNNSKEEKYWLKWLDNKPFTTLFLDGNHENFNLLYDYPTEDFKGGEVHKISDSVYHLIRGEIYEIDNKSIFVMGGAESHDKEYRVEGKSIWKEEIPTSIEIQNGSNNLDKYNNKVDYILSHCFTSRWENKMFGNSAPNILTDFFQLLEYTIDYNKWFFGHYHKDKAFDDKHICVYREYHKL